MDLLKIPFLCTFHLFKVGDDLFFLTYNVHCYTLSCTFPITSHDCPLPWRPFLFSTQIFHDFGAPSKPLAPPQALAPGEYAPPAPPRYATVRIYKVMLKI